MDPLSQLIGDSQGIVELRKTIRQLAGGHRERRLPPVLIQGETGAGKGLVARLLHRVGPRADHPFVDVNCAAIPETLLEAELFGFERGAFTDARQAKPGLFQIAHRGTLFLDEVGLLPIGLQVKLLKCIEEGVVRRLGSVKSEPIDVWVISATNEDMTAALREKRFREDLYHRLAVLTLEIPRLRDRGDDIAQLAEHFLRRAITDYALPERTLAEDARQALRDHPWPGNVRELNNMMERAALLSDEPIITAEMLGLRAGRGAAETISGADALRERLQAVLAQTGGNITRAAAILRVTRKTVKARMDKYGMRTIPGRQGSPPARSMEPSVVRPLAPARPAGPLRWEIRYVAFLKAVVDSVAAGQRGASRALEIFAEKAQAFGGLSEGSSPAGIVLVFGLDIAQDAVTQDAATLAGHAALAMLNGVEHARREESLDVVVRIAVHTLQGHVSIAEGRIDLDADVRREAWNTLDSLIGFCQPTAIAASAAAESFLNRRFEVTSEPGIHGVHRLLGLQRIGVPTSRYARFIGRDIELEVLARCVASAAEGHGQIVGVTGDAGIGKSRLVRELRHRVEGRPVEFLDGYCLSVASLQPFFPIVRIVREACDIGEADDRQTITAKISRATEALGSRSVDVTPFVLRLLALQPSSPPPGTLSPEATKRRMFEAVTDLLLRFSRHQTLVIVLEDLHWIDRASEEFFEQFVTHVADNHVLLLATYRAGFAPGWVTQSNATQIALPPLSRNESRAVLAAASEGDLPLEIVDAILDKAQGNPFFVEELARATREAPGATITRVPDTVHEVLLARLMRLDPDDRRIVLTAAVIGKGITGDLLHRLVDSGEESVTAALARLRRAEFLVDASTGFESLPRYVFKHALTQEVAYGALPLEERRQLHGRIARMLDAEFPELCAGEPELMAHHYTQAGLVEPAVGYWQKAGAQAIARPAYKEAVAHLSQALRLAEQMGETRVWLERRLLILLTLGQASIPLRGYGHSQTVAAFTRAQELVGAMSDAPHRFSVFYAVWVALYVRGEHDKALETAGSMVREAERDSSNSHMFTALRSLAMSQVITGAPVLAIDTFERTLALSGSLRQHSREERITLADRFSTEPDIATGFHLGLTLWCLGRIDAARSVVAEALASARALGHVHTLCHALAYSSVIAAFNRSVDEALALSAETIDFASRHELEMWKGYGSIIHAHALALNGEAERSIHVMERGFAWLARTQTGNSVPAHHAVHARTLASLGRFDEAERYASMVRTELKSGSGRYYWPECQRLLGDYLRLCPGREPAEAEPAYLNALSLAREQHATTWQFYAAISLAQLWADQGKATQAADLLETSCDGFTERRSLPAWKEAETLREQLRSQGSAR